MNPDNPDPPAGFSPSNDMHFSILGQPFKISRFTFLLILGVVVGAVTGGVAVLFHKAAFYGKEFLFPHTPNTIDLFSLSTLKRLVMPGLGGLACGFLLFRVGNFKGGHSIPAILRAVASGQSFFKLKMALPAVLSTITIATGGSVGPEGPIAEIGSVTGSLTGRLAKMPPKMMKPLIGAGVAAGISAVFNAPFAGVFFAIEVILRNYEIASFTPIAVAAVVASIVAHAALGEHMAFTYPAALAIPTSDILFFAILGLLCGFTSLLYIHGIDRCHHFFVRFQKIPLWLKPAFGGLLVGVVGVFFPEVMGEGYQFIQVIVNPAETAHSLESITQVGVSVLVVLVLLKILATGLTLGSGNPGGSFAPAVFIGIAGGAAFGQILERFGWVDSYQPYAVMAMAGMVAGALGAPITAIMLTMRQGMNQPQLLLPVMTTVALSMFIMQRKHGVTVYTLGFLRSGIDIDHVESDPLSLVTVGSFTHRNDFIELPASMQVKAALDRLKNTDEHFFIVRNEQGLYAGILSLHEMRLAIAEEELANLLVLSDLTDPMMPHLHPEMNLKDTLSAFSAVDAEVLPVFESPHDLTTFIGVLSRQDALNAYQQTIENA